MSSKKHNFKQKNFFNFKVKNITLSKKTSLSSKKWLHMIEPKQKNTSLSSKKKSLKLKAKCKLILLDKEFFLLKLKFVSIC